MLNMRGMEDMAFTVLETKDIGGTNSASGWLAMQDFEDITAIVELGTWDSGDDLDECKFQQATDGSGTGVKDLTSDESGGNYDTDAPVDADGDQVILGAKASEMDAANGFTHVRLFLAEAGNTGVDNVTATVIRHNSKHPQKEKQGAASVSLVYVTPES